MVNVSKIACDSLKPYTQNGCRLLIKKTSLVSDLMPKNIIPKNCTSIDFVEAETNFGRGSTKIVTFKDKCDNLIKRVINKTLGEDTDSIVRQYNRDDNVLFITSRKYKNGVRVGNTEEAVYRNNIFSRRITRMKLDMDLLPDGSRVEKQVYEELAPRTRGKYLETTALRSKDGTLSDKTIKASDDYILENVKGDPYLYIRNYNRRDFAKSASYYAEEKQGTKGHPSKFFDERLEDCEGYCQDSTQDIYIDSTQNDKIGLVYTLNHEYRHKMQRGFILKARKSFFNIFRKPEKRVVFKPGEKELAMKFWKADIKYPIFDICYKFYEKNFLEVDARNAGEIAQKEYRTLSNKLAEIFGIPQQMVHNKTIEEYIKELTDKIAILRKSYGIDK